MIDISNLNLKSTTKCECGYQFTLNDLTTMNRINEHGFYGNTIKHYSKRICPNCQKHTILFLKQKGQTWEIINIATDESKIDTATEKYQDKEFICPECGMSCKSKLGLNSHMRTHRI